MSFPPTGTDMIGTVAGYRVERMLGRGSGGIVYLAHDVRLDRKVALKLLDAERLSDERSRGRFFREWQLAAAIDHPNIVPVYEAGEVDGRLFIVMRYVEGGDLRARIRGGPMPAVEAIALLAQVADALDAAHAHGLVHRDVKPSNVLVAPGRGSGGTDHAYLADFGLSSRAGDDSGAPPARVLGTIDYVAPEQIAAGEVDGRADGYSLGCMLYELLVGEPPFRSRHELEVLFGHLERPPPSVVARRPELPAGIDDVIARALAKSPSDRFESCSALIRAAAGELGRPESRSGRSRHRLAAVFVGAAVVAAAAAAAVILSGESRPTTEPGSSVTAVITTDAVARVDPETFEITGTTPIGDAAGLVATPTAIWVADGQQARITALDPSTGGEIGLVDLEPLPVPKFFAVGDGVVWAGRTGTYFVAADVATGGVRELAARPLGIAFGSAGLFAPIAPWHVARLDPGTGEEEEKVDLSVGGACDCLSGAIAVGEDAVWIAGGVGTADAVFRLDPSTGRLARTDVGAVVLDLAPDAQGVWALTADDSVVRIDSDGRAVRAVSVGRGLVAVAVGDGAIWVASGRDSTVTRIDPTTYDLATLELGAVPIDLAFASGVLWVSVDGG